MTTFKQFLEITQQEFALFHSKTQNPQSLAWLKTKLLALGWPQEFINYHEKDEEGTNMPFAELRNVLLHINQYANPVKTQINPQQIPMEQGDYAERETKYDQYISGQTKTYFRGNQSDPRQVNFSNMPPITVVMGLKYEVIDGMHRVFLAKKQNVPSIPAWVIKQGVNNHPVAKEIVNFFYSQNPM